MEARGQGMGSAKKRECKDAGIGFFIKRKSKIRGNSGIFENPRIFPRSPKFLKTRQLTNPKRERKR